MKKIIATAATVLILMVNQSQANTARNVQQEIAHQWEAIEFSMDKANRVDAYKVLSHDVSIALQENTENDPELLTWAGIVNASYAGSKGGLGALKLVKLAKKQLESAISLDADAANGGAMTTLGTLYAQVPGWPISFGNKDKANRLLEASANKHPSSLVAQYFYGKYLYDQNNLALAKLIFEKAKKIPPREQSLRSDTARLSEISKLLVSME